MDDEKSLRFLRARALALSAGALTISVLHQVRAALRPAMRPNTAPDMRPVPNG